MSALASFVMLATIRHSKLHKYGRHTIDEDNSPPEEHGVLFYLLSVGLFGVPREYLRRIRAALTLMKLQGRVDVWAEFLDSFDKELKIPILAATVILAASCSFLAVEGIGDTPLTMLLLSITFTMGSLMTGSFLQSQAERMKCFDIISCESAATYVFAVLFSIPVALLTWATGILAAAILAYTARGFQPEPGRSATHFGPETYAPVFASSFTFLCLGCIMFFYFRGVRNHMRRIPPLPRGSWPAGLPMIMTSTASANYQLLHEIGYRDPEFAAAPHERTVTKRSPRLAGTTEARRPAVPGDQGARTAIRAATASCPRPCPGSPRDEEELNAQTASFSHGLDEPQRAILPLRL
ncbi:hypothetical protein GLOTRDRAFT_132697 [Gloeophyllum trabeum ATCC 11539]|uniref:Uncharacterized protein n=1 Tax=Gloeophyllum trabeum (strain ATCC 11539 / FP-39264 / Madison 617) TaxID=670483 RepID=S7PW86_GLOTA|nr:uncharacterized protein GLOTRDRAFT_132697 [Gloeophyllum trabeum ATCC 11539]EPQ51886.1 hypothetical protein GLOTRDRAFT_132697 [Gloeophyllum trabeum ATCC 11539]